ncbi:hypothetical protein CL616_02910, partial [archaeon]|nr:hypothetical protein [archaeon]
LYMVDGLDTDNIYSLFIDSQGINLFASTDAQPGVYMLDIQDSNELGDHSWESLDIFARDSVVSDVVVSNNDPDVIYTVAFPGGVFKSEDRGDSWHEKTGALVFEEMFSNGVGFEDSFYKLEMNPTDSNMLLLGSYAGDIYVTYDGGDSWEEFERGLVRNGAVFDFKFSSDGSIVYVSQKAGGVSKMELKNAGEATPDFIEEEKPSFLNKLRNRFRRN